MDRDRSGRVGDSSAGQDEVRADGHRSASAVEHELARECSRRCGNHDERRSYRKHHSAKGR
jgi:hypothetical protein